MSMTFAQRPHPENGVRGWVINFSCIEGDDCNMCVCFSLCVCVCVCAGERVPTQRRVPSYYVEGRGLVH